MTRTAAEMREPIPANMLFGIRVRRAAPDGAENAGDRTIQSMLEQP